jgi:transglutaminase-like putative cysteine protease
MLTGRFDDAFQYGCGPRRALGCRPLDVLRLGIGDCKDYALAKYFALRQAGDGRDRPRL